MVKIQNSNVQAGQLSSLKNNLVEITAKKSEVESTQLLKKPNGLSLSEMSTAIKAVKDGSVITNVVPDVQSSTDEAFHADEATQIKIQNSGNAEVSYDAQTTDNKATQIATPTLDKSKTDESSSASVFAKTSTDSEEISSDGVSRIRDLSVASSGGASSSKILVGSTSSANEMTRLTSIVDDDVQNRLDSLECNVSTSKIYEERKKAINSTTSAN